MTGGKLIHVGFTDKPALVDPFGLEIVVVNMPPDLGPIEMEHLGSLTDREIGFAQFFHPGIILIKQGECNILRHYATQKRHEL